MSTVPSAAVQVLEAFLDAAQRADLDGMKACLTRQSLESSQFNGSGPQGLRMVVGETHMEGATAVVAIKGFPLDAPPDGAPAMEMVCLLMEENGAWKFDLAGTAERMMGGGLDAAMQQVAEGMSQAMDGVGQALSAALGGQAAAGGAGEAGEDDASWDQASLTPAADELFPLPALVRLPLTTTKVSQAVGSEVPVEAAIADLLAQLGSDERDQLVSWLDNSLFGAWDKVFATPGVPTANRLRSVRIEPAKRPENRVVALDGSDLVYRMWLNHTDGYFSDTYLAAMMPCVLAGLPETIDPAVAGHRSLPLDEDRPTSESYRRLWVPRWMRRIRALFGQPIRLEIDWRSAADANNIGPALPLWGLNRIYGALAFTCLYPERKAELTRDLKTIELAVGQGVAKKFARYESGKLSVGISYYGGDTPGCYENDIAVALAGTPLE